MNCLLRSDNILLQKVIIQAKLFMKKNPVRKRKNNPVKVIVTLILILIAAYGISEWLPLNFKRPWHKDIISEQTDLITTLVVNQGGTTGDELTFSRLDSGVWQLTVNNHLQQADPAKIKTLLAMLQQVVAIRMIPHDDPDYNKTGLKQGLATEVQVYHDQVISSHFLVGNARFDTATNQFISYLKNINDRNAYEVNGNFEEAFNLPWKRYLVSPVVDLKIEDLLSVTFRFPCDSLIRFEINNGKWINPADGKVINTQSLQQLLAHITNMRAFDPDSDDLYWLEQKQKVLFTDQLELKFKDLTEPLVLSRTALPDHPEFQYIFTNSLFPYMNYTMEKNASRSIFQWQKMIMPREKTFQKAVIGF